MVAFCKYFTSSVVSPPCLGWPTEWLKGMTKMGKWAFCALVFCTLMGPMTHRSDFNLLTELLSLSAMSCSLHLFPSILSSNLYHLSTLLVLILCAYFFHLVTPFFSYKPPHSYSRLMDWVINFLQSGVHQLRVGLFKLGFNIFSPPHSMFQFRSTSVFPSSPESKKLK